jgi:hypothetical protein
MGKSAYFRELDYYYDDILEFSCELPVLSAETKEFSNLALAVNGGHCRTSFGFSKSMVIL